MSGDFSLDLTLATISEGQLNEEFQRAYQDVLSSLEQGDKGKITINIHFKRLEDMATMVGVEYDLKAHKPTKKRASIASIKENEQGHLSLMTDRPREKKSGNLKLFPQNA